MSSNSAANEAKANFDDVYSAPTPHAYISSMAKHGYEIGERARPYCVAAAELLRELNGEAWPVQMLDVGCSYGIGSAFVKYDCSFDEFVLFFGARAPRKYRAACEATRLWLNIMPPACDVRAVGLDSSGAAVRFAVDAGLLDGGIIRNFEESDVVPTDDEKGWFRSSNLLISTGAIGYVTERTFDVVLEHLGKDSPCEFGPFVLVTILRMFDSSPIQSCFEHRGYSFDRVPDIRLPQRHFVNAEERRRVLSLLHDRGLDTGDWEDRGKHYADVFIAAPREQFSRLMECMSGTRSAGNDKPVGYIRR